MLKFNLIGSLVVEEVDDAGSPLAAGNDVAVGAEEAQQAQRGRLLHHVESITKRDLVLYMRGVDIGISLTGLVNFVFTI